MTGELIVSDYQFQYGDLLMGVDTSYDVEEISGLLGYATLRSSTVDAFGMHGGVPGRHYVGSRQFVVEMNILGSEDQLAYHNLRSAAARAFQPRTHPHDEISFAYQLPPNIRRYINCRPVNNEMPLDVRFANLKYPHVTLRFECTDPRHYDIETKTEIATLPTAGGGLDFPLQFPLNFGPGSSSAVQLSNDLDAPANWVCEITGPVTDPKIEAVSTIENQIFRLQFSGLSLVQGETMVLNSRDRSVLLAEQSRRAFLVPGSMWFTIPPHPNYLTVNYTSGDVPTTASTATFTWSDSSWGS